MTRHWTHEDTTLDTRGPGIGHARTRLACKNCRNFLKKKLPLTQKNLGPHKHKESLTHFK
ncbi:uncharacterized protein DS421_13g423310 [Arachis hypogaea]|nr:uncharacterized protein DS421_13g423310 [Arachis hypogaea]